MYLLPDLRGCTRFLLMLCLALAPLGVAAGEAADPPLFVQVRTTYVQPGMAAKYEEFLTRLNAARQKAGEDRGTFVTRSRTGRNAYYGITLYDRYSDLQGSGLGSLFNTYYEAHKINVPEANLARTRVALVQALRTVLANGLAILGIRPLERM